MRSDSDEGKTHYRGMSLSVSAVKEKEIISLLSKGIFKTSELLSYLRIKRPCLSHHMKRLKKEGIIKIIPGKIERDNKGRFINIQENSWILKNVNSINCRKA